MVNLFCKPTVPDATKYHEWIGLTITKKSGKPFKSGLKDGIPLAMAINPYRTGTAFLMNDGSIVNAHQCKLK